MLALPRKDPAPSKGPQYVSGTGPPGAPQHDDFVKPALPVTGAAPWALSALPECFRQLSSASGPAGFVRAKLPLRALRLPPGVRLHVADCSVAVGTDSALVTRGENRLSVPARARLYLADGHLVLERQSFTGREDMRIYAPRGALTFTPPLARAKPESSARRSDE